MRKLKLDLDDLMVEAFETVDTPAAEGTVEAHGRTITVACGTCYVSCNYSACPVDCTGFYSECCSIDGPCTPSYDYTCGEACTAVC
jgi:hypothetical protein